MKCDKCGHVSGVKVPLTPKQQDVMDFIITFDDGSDKTPTYRQMANYMNCSHQSISDKLRELERKGHIYRVPGARGIAVL